MSVAGPRIAGTGANDATVGTVAWTNAGNITANDGADATASAVAASSTTQFLKATNFGFTIPATATIDGIIFTIEASASGSPVLDTRVSVVKANGSIGATNLSDEQNWGTGPALFNYGSSTSLWGETWTAADINDADFGVVFQALNASASNKDVSADYVSCTVHYTLKLTAAQASLTLSGIAASFRVNRQLSATQATLTLAGQVATLVLERLWVPLTKNTSTFSQTAKSSSSWTNASKNTSTFTNEDKS